MYKLQSRLSTSLTITFAHNLVTLDFFQEIKQKLSRNLFETQTHILQVAQSGTESWTRSSLSFIWKLACGTFNLDILILESLDFEIPYRYLNSAVICRTLRDKTSPFWWDPNKQHVKRKLISCMASTFNRHRKLSASNSKRVSA